MTVQSIEAAAAVAWPPKESLTLGSWELSAGDGFSRRRNSAVPAGPLPENLERRFSDVGEWYRVRGLPTLYRITPLCDTAVDDVLTDRGLVLEAPTLVMSRSLVATDLVEGVAESPVVTDTWVETELAALGIDRSSIGPWLAPIAAVPSPASFVVPVDGGESAVSSLMRCSAFLRSWCGRNIDGEDMRAGSWQPSTNSAGGKGLGEPSSRSSRMTNQRSTCTDHSATKCPIGTGTGALMRERTRRQLKPDRSVLRRSARRDKLDEREAR